MLVQEAVAILEVGKNDTPEQVKRAYVKALRKHPPEKDPQGFQQVRAAYELLKDGVNDEFGPLFTFRDEEEQRLALQLASLVGEKNFAQGRELGERLIPWHGDSQALRYYFGQCQLGAKNPGKAANTFQKLVEEDPDNRWFLRMEALAFFERNWKKKAITAFDKAMRMGIHDPEFTAAYVHCLDEYSYESEEYEVLKSFFSEPVLWSRESAEPIFYLLGEIKNYSRLDEEMIKNLLSFWMDMMEKQQNLLTGDKVFFSSVIYRHLIHVSINKKVQETLLENIPEASRLLLALFKSSSIPEETILGERITLLMDYVRGYLHWEENLWLPMIDFLMNLVLEKEEEMPDSVDVMVRWNMCIYRDDFLKGLDFLRVAMPEFMERYQREVGRVQKNNAEVYRMRKELQKKHDRYAADMEEHFKMADFKCDIDEDYQDGQYFNLVDDDDYDDYDELGDMSMDEKAMFMELFLEMMKQERGKKRRGRSSSFMDDFPDGFPFW